MVECGDFGRFRIGVVPRGSRGLTASGAGQLWCLSPGAGLAAPNAKPRLDMPDERLTEYYSKRYSLHWQAAVAKEPRGRRRVALLLKLKDPALPQLDLQRIFSLEAFDADDQGSGATLVPCAFPDDAPLVEIAGGTCGVDDPDRPLTGVTVYTTERAQEATRYFRALEGRETAPVGRKRGVRGGRPTRRARLRSPDRLLPGPPAPLRRPRHRARGRPPDLVGRLTQRRGPGPHAPQGGSMVKLFVTETARRVGLEGMQMMGGYGYSSEYDVERLVRSTLVSTIYLGTSEIQRGIIAKTLGL